MYVSFTCTQYWFYGNNERERLKYVEVHVVLVMCFFFSFSKMLIRNWNVSDEFASYLVLCIVHSGYFLFISFYLVFGRCSYLLYRMRVHLITLMMVLLNFSHGIS